MNLSGHAGQCVHLLDCGCLHVCHYTVSGAMVLTSTTVLHSLTCVWSGPVGEPGAITGYKHTPVNRGQSHLQATALSELTSTQRTVEGQWQCGCNALHILLMPQFAQNSFAIQQLYQQLHAWFGSQIQLVQLSS